jgi:hypothetical protein
MNENAYTMRALATVTAVLELGAGLGMLAFPSLAGTILLGSPLSTPVELIIASVAGVALLALGVAFWFARHDEQSHPARALVGAMLLYNAGVVAVLLNTGIGLGLSGIGLWPVVLLHVVMTVWCGMYLRQQHIEIIR